MIRAPVPSVPPSPCRRPAPRTTGAASILAITAVLAMAAPAAAQAPSAHDLDELVVTAQRVEENIQRTPVAVTAFTGAALERQSVESLGDIALRTPGFTAGAVDSIQSNLAIRGIGSSFGISQNAGGDASVIVFVDGVYAGRGGTPDIDALDLARVEVLRGPQGTLFGKNAVGGLVQYVSRKPSADPSFRIETGVGDYRRFTLSAHGNLPLSDKAFLSAGAAYKSHAGYTFNETTGSRVDDEDLRTAALALRLLPAEGLDVTLAADFTHQDQKGDPRHNVCDPSVDGGIHCVGINPDPRVVDAYIDGYLRRDLRTWRAEAAWTTPVGALTSITALRQATLNFRTPFFSNPIRPPAQIESTETDHEHDRQFSQEARLSFGADESRLKGQAGAYFLDEHNARTEDMRHDFAIPQISGVGTYPQTVDARSFALFAQADLAVTGALTATAGVRETWERKSGHFIGRKVSGPGQPPPLVADYDVRASKSWRALTPRFALDWQAAPDAMLYASATRGFKSGGFQGIAGSAAGQSTPYDPEFAWSYEAGAKTQWWDGRARLDLAVYRTDYKDLQVSSLVPLCCVVVANAATARITGAEVEAVVTPIDGLQLDAAYARTRARFTSFANGATADYTGNVLPRAPRDKLHLGAQYGRDAHGWGMLARVDYTNQSKMYFDADNQPIQKQEGFVDWDGRLSVTSPDRRWEVAVWGKNLSNALVATYVTAYAPYGQQLVPYAPPRTWGVTLTWRN